MYHHHHSRRKKRLLKRSEKKVLLIALPITFIVAMAVSIGIVGIPKLFTTIFLNVHRYENIARELVRGSAARHETDIRKVYEKEWREDPNSKWVEAYENILQNDRDKEVEQLEKMFEEEKRDQ